MNGLNERLQIRRKMGWNLWRVLLWPFAAVWRLVTTVVKLVGRVAMLVSGMVMMIVGVLLTMTVIGAFIGIPLATLGFLLVLRSLF